MTKLPKSFYDTMSKALKEKNFAIFAGAGLSKPAGFVNWKELLRSIADDLKLDIDREHDLIAIAQYHINEKGGNRGRINQLIVDEFVREDAVTENHRILARLPIQTYWTTNYDKLIEQTLRDAGKTPDVKITQENLAQNVPNKDTVVYKMHGDISQPQHAVISKDDYEAYNSKRQLFSTTLQGDLISRTFLFIGFSFDDPNIDYILSRIRVLLGENQREHFCFFKKVKKEDFRSKDEFLYAQIKQDLRIKDLRRYSITGIEIDEYSDITEILKTIEDKFKRNSVFISGSAADYGSWDPDKALAFMHDLSKKICSEKFKVISGFGLGIGSAVINGGLEYIFSSNFRHLDENLVLRPFPQGIKDSKKRKELWTKYRNEMLSGAGIAIFVFGNKLNDKGELDLADGVYEEFDIAVKQGIKVIPIGATGFVAEDLWKRIYGDWKKYFASNSALKKSFKAIGDKKSSPAEIMKNVMDIVQILRNME